MMLRSKLIHGIPAVFQSPTYMIEIHRTITMIMTKLTVVPVGCS